ncbi:hypothetical protein BX616_004330 [Lobosporangium transversale]|nr:hypothetical protein BX616_004330 [Lobosporangium transversale]
MMAYSYLVEKDVIFTGSKTTPDGTQTVSVSSSVKHYNPYYNLDIHIEYSSSPNSPTKIKKSAHQRFSTAFQFWYDEDGVLVNDYFEADIKKFFTNTEAAKTE